jgi:hypothetical protein
MMLHKDYERNCSVAKKIAGRDSQGACRQDENSELWLWYPQFASSQVPEQRWSSQFEGRAHDNMLPCQSKRTPNEAVIGGVE